jgi:hypothetical protein
VREFAETQVLGSVQDEILTPDNIARFEKRLRSQLASPKPRAAPDPAARIAALDAQIDRYVAAIGQGLLSPALRDKLAEAEAEKAALLAAPPPAAPTNVVRLVTDAVTRYRGMVADLREWVSRDPECAQAILAGLFGVIPVDRKGVATLTLDSAKVLNLQGFARERELGGSGGSLLPKSLSVRVSLIAA